MLLALSFKAVLENPEADLRWYFKFFLGHDHKNFLANIIDDDGQKEMVLYSSVSIPFKEILVGSVVSNVIVGGLFSS